MILINIKQRHFRLFNGNFELALNAAYKVSSIKI